MKVEGSAESVYYALDDDKAYLGVNNTVCSEISASNFKVNTVSMLKHECEVGNDQ